MEKVNRHNELMVRAKKVTEARNQYKIDLSVAADILSDTSMELTTTKRDLDALRAEYAKVARDKDDLVIADDRIVKESNEKLANYDNCKKWGQDWYNKHAKLSKKFEAGLEKDRQKTREARNEVNALKRKLADAKKGYERMMENANNAVFEFIESEGGKEFVEKGLAEVVPDMARDFMHFIDKEVIQGVVDWSKHEYGRGILEMDGLLAQAAAPIPETPSPEVEDDEDDSVMMDSHGHPKFSAKDLPGTSYSAEDRAP